jgi:hypothetical protein
MQSGPFGIKQAALAVAMALAFAGAAGASGERHEHAYGAGEAKLVLNQGKKWQTDEPLRAGMDNVRAAVASDLKRIHSRKQTAEQYGRLAAQVNGEVASIVQNCKLDPEADAQLHLVLAQLLSGVETMEGRTKGATRREGAERIVKALNAYGQYFDHPGWKRLHD